MYDPGIAEFNNRIERIQKARAKGYGFEAEGALGRSFYSRKNTRRGRFWRVPVLRPLVIALMFGTVLKALVLYELGGPAYEMRVAGLLAQDGVARIGGWLMQADPLTATLAGQIGALARLDG
ncbi:hypothetical protein [Pseudorhodobacter sp. MZDSW-24AT]|uniref:hypothetical protein n=1 Tax=Pseudorhodobacter sp. MZDSW-24AT TaxID=2052957 RepID=UPI000C1F0E21|nr:hypothetical protein [Pseudorhodobacter sp. MZDSW-24AT]PJF08962.1 hypothetical protein CUR21_10835 [Pseudorhodobacter sp. MZDSW-24AT]